jgi:hypothetical protein
MNKVMKTKDGFQVVDRHNSHNHTSDMELLAEAISRIETNGRQFLVTELDMGRIVGATHCVETDGTDDIYYETRPGRRGPSRMVRNRKPEPCSHMVVILKKEDMGRFYILITSFVGKMAEPEPWDRNATPRSESFWANHALIAE